MGQSKVTFNKKKEKKKKQQENGIYHNQVLN